MIDRLMRRVARWFGFIPAEDVAEYAEMDALFIALGVDDEARTRAIRAASLLAKAGMIPSDEAAEALVRAMVAATPSATEWSAESEACRRGGRHAEEDSRE